MRESGILMHITSLSSPYGIGTMGKEAYKFVDFLKSAGQSLWQILPLTPTGYGDSPYQSCSTFAGNHYLIDLDALIEAGLLEKSEVADRNWSYRDDKVDFGTQYNNRLAVLRLAFNRFADQEALDAFCREQASWLPDFALFMALKGRNNGQPWYQWEDCLKFRDPEAIWKVRQELKEEIRFYCFVQYLFFTQWTALRSYAHKNGIRIIGDVPIYVPYDSVDVWSNPELFQLDAAMNPTDVAGCPPDAFSDDGQLWGNPLYRWDVIGKDGFGWWIRRLAAAGELYDIVRLDHFRGFEAYWTVPFGDTTARNGRWVKGPGMDMLGPVLGWFPGLQLIAEDLGFLTEGVKKLLADSKLPGMKVLEFAFDAREPSNYLPHTYTKNCVCYVGTHDNAPIMAWKEETGADELAMAKKYLGLTEEEGLNWGIIRGGMTSVADLFIVQIQDYLGLGNESRMNTPGVASGNWQWRLKKNQLTKKLAARIADLTWMSGRDTNPMCKKDEEAEEAAEAEA